MMQCVLVSSTVISNSAEEAEVLSEKYPEGSTAATTTATSAGATRWHGMADHC